MILASLSAFLFFALEAATNMFPKIVFLCLQGDEAEMTRPAEKKRISQLRIPGHQAETASNNQPAESRGENILLF
jgi:hypothetical protein